MAIEIIKSSDALAVRRANLYADWPNRKSDHTRLYPIAAASHPAKFDINSSDKVFCIGSCFAREIESSLSALGFEVLSKVRDLPNSQNRQGGDAGLANKYTIGSILAEIKNCLEIAQDFKGSFLKSGEKYADCTLGGTSHLDSVENLTSVREAFSKQFERIKDATVIILTLGLSEAWLDKSTGIFLNVAPPVRAMKKEPDRFELHVLDYHETFSMLQGCVRLIFGNLRPDVRMLLTVSPVPLLTTFRMGDVLVSNGYSKAVLRAAVEEISFMNDNVCYFPSYEIATLSNPMCVWSDKDFRHVDSSFVSHITSSAAMSFVNAQDLSIRNQNVLAKCKALYRAGFFREAEQLLLDAHGPDPSSFPLSASVLRMAMIYRRLENWQSSLIFYEAYQKLEPEDGRAADGLRIVRDKLKKKLNQAK
jgi:tetratricopeptide (TPR) repeat protein